MPGLFGFSVQYADAKSVEELAYAGRFPHAQISYASDDALHMALQPRGYTMKLVKTARRGSIHPAYACVKTLR